MHKISNAGRPYSYKTAKNETKTKGDKIDRSSNKTDEMQIAKKYLYTLDVHTYGYILRRLFKTVLSSFKFEMFKCKLLLLEPEGESGLCR